MKAMVQAPRDRAAPPEAHEGGAPARPKKRAAVQWAPRSLLGFDSLAMSQPGDASEREADAAAQRLVQGLPAQVGALPRVGVQRRCAACASAPATPCATCGTREEEELPPVVQRRATGIPSAFLGVNVVPSGGGAPLPGEVRSTFGRLLGHDLSGVRVHTGAEAARSAEGLSAEAYTVGDDVVFAAGRYAPQTRAGRELIAHELAHVAQQRSVGAGRPSIVQRQPRSTRPDEPTRPPVIPLAARGGVSVERRSVEGAPTAYRLWDFDVNSAVLKLSHLALLDGRIRRMLGNGRTSVTLLGGASPTGEARHNRELARARALAVRDHLVQDGVDPQRIAVGETAPGGGLEAGEDPLLRAVVVQLDVRLDARFSIGLQNAEIVRPSAVLIETVRAAFEPIAADAGRPLEVVASTHHRGDEFYGRLPDVVIPFQRRREDQFGPGARHVALGDEGSGVQVDVWEDMRVTRGPRARFDGARAGEPVIDYHAQVENLFWNGEEGFARAVANTAIHELGHNFGLDHRCDDPENFMFTIGRNECGRGGRRYFQGRTPTREMLRRFWSRTLRFDAEQRRVILESIRDGVYAREGMIVHRGIGP